MKYTQVHTLAYMHAHTHTADRAICEMNRKEKEIIRAYLRAVKYASQLESRVRIMVIGDTETGECVCVCVPMCIPYCTCAVGNIHHKKREGKIYISH